MPECITCWIIPFALEKKWIICDQGFHIPRQGAGGNAQLPRISAGLFFNLVVTRLLESGCQIWRLAKKQQKLLFTLDYVQCSKLVRRTWSKVLRMIVRQDNTLDERAVHHSVTLRPTIFTLTLKDSQETPVSLK